jgi:hypothetical protein
MQRKEQLLKLIPEQGILPLYFYKDTEVSLQVLKALYNAGIRAVEYTNRGAAALENFREMRKLCDTELKGMYLGIGTIKNGEMAQTFIDAGADYLKKKVAGSGLKRRGVKGKGVGGGKGRRGAKGKGFLSDALHFAAPFASVLL